MFEPLNIILLLLGGAIHLFGTLKERSVSAGHKVTLREYNRNNPYQLALGLVTSITCYILFFNMGELNGVSAFLAGYVGDSLIKKIINTTRWRQQ